MGDGAMSHAVVIIIIAIIPFFIMVCTSFAKVLVVLHITKNAFGAQGIPPMTVISALALVISIFIMGPVIDETLDREVPKNTVENINSDKQDKDIKAQVESAKTVYEAFSPPIIKFLKNNTPKDEIAFFQKIDPAKSKNSIRVLLIAFASNELVEAMLLGILVFLPFLVIDLITGLTLGALGLSTIPMVSISLPLKLLLFIAADGWRLLVNALVVSYNMQ